MKNINSTKFRGSAGEAIASEFLRERGYKIIAMGYHSRFGEIDIIAESDDYIVFCEVKLRKIGSEKYVSAREFVDFRKQQKLLTTAQIWLSENETEKQPRFDVIEIYASDDMTHREINHIEDAF